MRSARSLGLQHAVRFFGAQTLDQIVAAINECDVGIIPNHRNMFTEMNTPTRIFEYLARGKPVIAPLAQGICDYFGPEDLVFFKLGDQDDLAQKMEFVFSNYSNLKEIVARGQKVYSMHQWQHERERMLQEMAGLLSGETSARERFKR